MTIVRAFCLLWTFCCRYNAESEAKLEHTGLKKRKEFFSLYSTHNEKNIYIQYLGFRYTLKWFCMREVLLFQAFLCKLKGKINNDRPHDKVNLSFIQQHYVGQNMVRSNCDKNAGQLLKGLLPNCMSFWDLSLYVEQCLQPIPTSKAMWGTLWWKFMIANLVVYQRNRNCKNIFRQSAATAQQRVNIFLQSNNSLLLFMII